MGRSNAWFALVCLAAAVAGCNSNTTSTTSPSTTTTSSTTAATTTATAIDSSTIVFTTNVPVGGTGFYSFTASQPGALDLTLVGVKSGSSTLTTAIGLGNGTPNGLDCDMTSSVSAVPGLTAQLRTRVPAGVGCVKVFDIGTLREPVAITVRIVHP